MAISKKEEARIEAAKKSKERRDKYRDGLRDSETKMKAPYAHKYKEAKAALRPLLQDIKDGTEDLSPVLHHLSALCDDYPQFVMPDACGLHGKAFLAVPFRKAVVTCLFGIAESEGTVIAAHETRILMKKCGSSAKLAARLERHFDYFKALTRFKFSMKVHGETLAIEFLNQHAAAEKSPMRRNNLIKIAQRYINSAS